MQNEKPQQAISERNTCFAKAYAQMDWSLAQTDSAPVGIKNKQSVHIVEAGEEDLVSVEKSARQTSRVFFTMLE